MHTNIYRHDATLADLLLALAWAGGCDIVLACSCTPTWCRARRSFALANGLDATLSDIVRNDDDDDDDDAGP